MSERPCPKCQGSMEQGFVLDATYAGYFFSRWISGTPEFSAWTGNVKDAKHRDCRRVDVFRCSRCGFLESYALEELSPPGWSHP